MQNILQNFKSGVQGGPPLREENFVGCSTHPFLRANYLYFAIQYYNIFECETKGGWVGGTHPFSDLSIFFKTNA